MSETRTDARLEEARKQMDAVLGELDEIARRHDNYEYGLPIYSDHCLEAMRNVLASYALSREREVWEEAAKVADQKYDLGQGYLIPEALRARAAELKEGQ